MPRGLLPTDMVAMTLVDAVSVAETVP